VDTVSDLELGGPQELSIGLGGEKLSDASDLVADGRKQPTLDAVSLVALLGCQVEWEAGHERGLP
jgi:hypothetical protein